MKILMINVTCGTGSTGRICTDLADALKARGHTVKIAYGRGDVPEKNREDCIRVGNTWDILCHGIFARVFDRAGLGSTRATKALVAWIREYDPDVIHLHNLHGYYLNVQQLFSYLRSCGKPIFWTLHDVWALTGHCATFYKTDCPRYETGCSRCPQRREYPASLLDFSRRNWEWKRKAFAGIPKLTLITPSHWLEGFLPGSILGEYPVQVIPNGINTGDFCPGDSRFRKEKNLRSRFLILGVANIWGEQKGLSDFYTLAEQLDERFQIVLVGLSEKQLKKLPPKIWGVRRTGSVEELADIYRGADVFLNLTYSDTYPTVNLEALCCGTPVITYKTGGSPESLLSPECGFVAPQGDTEQVKDLIYAMSRLPRQERRVCYPAAEADSKRVLCDYLRLYDREEKG